MTSRHLVLGLAATALVASSCQSAARDAFVEAYENARDDTTTAETCRIEERTLAVASEAYWADNGTAATSIEDLTPAYLREAPTGWSFDSSGELGEQFVPTRGGRCATALLEEVDGDDSGDGSIGRLGANAISDGLDLTCATDKRTVETAIEIFYVENGYDPTSPGDLSQYLDDELTRWTIQVPVDDSNGVPLAVPLAGGDCDR